jgi:MFS family permease
METSEKAGEHETIENVKSEHLEVAFDRTAEKRLLWKLDIHVVPILMILFLMAFLDRINIGNAAIQGLETDLNMGGHDFNIALFIFFIPYILLEVPSNLILRKVPPSWWISGIMFLWGMVDVDPSFNEVLIDLPYCQLGITTICQGVTKSFGGLVACRFLLGIFEAGFMPGQYFSGGAMNSH